MPMFVFKIGKIFIAIWKFIKFFVIELYTAIRFAIINYDSKLQMTKTKKQRIVFWTVAGAIVIALLFLLLHLSGEAFTKYIHI